MPTILSDRFMGFGYNELGKDELKETVTYLNKMKEFEEFIQEQYDGDHDRFCEEMSMSYDEFKKSEMVKGMIKEKLMWTYHHRGVDKLYYVIGDPF